VLGGVEEILLRRCSSSLSTPLSTEATSMTTSTVPVLAARSSTILPFTLLKRPRWVDQPKWSISYIGMVWRGSMV
jgi:hypothetical protein